VPLTEMFSAGAETQRECMAQEREVRFGQARSTIRPTWKLTFTICSRSARMFSCGGPRIIFRFRTWCALRPSREQAQPALPNQMDRHGEPASRRAARNENFRPSEGV